MTISRRDVGTSPPCRIRSDAASPQNTTTHGNVTGAFVDTYVATGSSLVTPERALRAAMTPWTAKGQRQAGTWAPPEEEAAAATVLSSLGAVAKRAINLRERKGSAAGKQSVPTPPASTTTGTTGTTGDASRGSGSGGDGGYARRGQLWTDAEEAQFEKGLEKCGPDYKRISQEFVPTRTIESVRNHARKIRNKLAASGSKPPTQAVSTLGKRKHSDGVRTPWSEAEQEAFSRGVAKLGRGPEAWKPISEDFVRTRSPEEVEEYARDKESLLHGSLFDRVRSAKRSRKTLYSTRMNARGDEHKRSLKYATNLFDGLQRMVKHESQRKKRMMVTMDQLFEKGNLNAQSSGTDMPLSDIFAYRTHGVSDTRRRKLTDASRMFLTTWLDHTKSAYEFPFERDEGANERGGTLSFHVNDMAEHCADILRERVDTPPPKMDDDAKPLAKVRGRPTAEVTTTAIRGGLLRAGPPPYCAFEYVQRHRMHPRHSVLRQSTDDILKRGKEAWDDYMLSESSRLIRRFLREIYKKEAAANNRAPEETHRYGFALATTHAVGWGLSNDFGLPIPVVAIGTPSSDGGGRASLVVPLVGKDPRALWCFSDPIELRSTEDNIIWSELENTFPEREAFAWATAADEKNIEAWKKLCLDTFSARGIKPPDEFHENAEQILMYRSKKVGDNNNFGPRPDDEAKTKLPEAPADPWESDISMWEAIRQHLPHLELEPESLGIVTEKLSARVKELARKQTN